MNVSIIAVNYNTYPELQSFLRSVDNAASTFLRSVDEAATDLPGQADGAAADGKGFDVRLFIADNSTQKQETDLSAFSHIGIEYLPLDNLGYFGGAAAVLKAFPEACQADYTIVSNVDLTYDSGFFLALAKVPKETSTAWIAPRIHSAFEQRDRNPKRDRYSRRKLSLMRIKFRFPWLNTLYNKTLYKRAKRSLPVPAGPVYSAHGAVIILARAFFEQGGTLSYPMFLFCEELFLAEQIAVREMKVLYCPDILVHDLDHVSTSRMNWRIYCQANLKAVNYILNRFYK